MLIDASPELFLNAYRHGVFPMAEDADDAFYNFYAPHDRALLPIKNLHISKSLMKSVKKQSFEIKINTAFEDVITACAHPYKNRDTTWINNPIKQTFLDLHNQGYTHSVECWDGGELVGGLYGIAIGKVFCGESMFSIATNASKIALVHLCARLYEGGFEILDSQFSNPHLLQFGLYEIPQEEYVDLIQDKMNKNADFICEGKAQSELINNYLSARKK